MKKLLTILTTVILSSGATFGAITVTQTTDQLVLAQKHQILKENAELHSRLNEPAVWDVSVATAQDISQAYVDVANALGVTSADIIAQGGNVQTAIQNKLQKAGKMCKI